MSQVTDLSDYRRQRDSDTRAAPVKVEREADPENPNRSYYLITGETGLAVQTAINGLVAEVESFGSGYGHFIGPRRGMNGRYFAIGEVVVHPDPYGRPDV